MVVASRTKEASSVLNKRLAVALTVSALLAGVTACGAPAQTAPAPATPSAATAATAPATGWELDPASGAQRIKAAGLDVLTAEGTAEHYHAHLDVLVDGKAVTVPAEIGFSFGADGRPNGISALHTHDTTGILHIEAPTAGQKYTLG